MKVNTEKRVQSLIFGYVDKGEGGSPKETEKRRDMPVLGIRKNECEAHKINLGGSR